MKREDITKLFPEATKEQIDSLMAVNGEDINKAKGDTAQLQKDLEKARTDLAAAKSGDPEELQRAKDEAAQYKNELDAMKLADSLREMRGKVAKAKNIPAELLTGDTEEACTAQADKILAFAKVPAAPTLPNPGEPTGANAKPDTAQQFAEWSKNLI
jgi:hypothetical protein